MPERPGQSRKVVVAIGKPTVNRRDGGIAHKNDCVGGRRCVGEKRDMGG